MQTILCAAAAATLMLALTKTGHGQGRYEPQPPRYYYDSYEHRKGGGGSYSGSSEHFKVPARPSWEQRGNRYRNSRSPYDGGGMYDRRKWDWYGR